MLRHLHDNLGLDVLASPPRHVVDNARAILQAGFQVHDDASRRGFAIVRIDQQGTVHAYGKPFLRGIDGLSGVVASRVADNGNLATKFGLGMCDQSQVLLPGEEMALAGCAADDQGLHPVDNLVLDVPVKGCQVDVTVLAVGRLDRRHEVQLADSLHRRRRHGPGLLEGRTFWHEGDHKRTSAQWAKTPTMQDLGSCGWRCGPQ
mmetsp:Transcript_36238/g.84302  ORF Transcript_36238/g.84302 Transcript_36238/m.84302 type:complete len:204 (+) Transcript_36238:564-1175(+)